MISDATCNPQGLKSARKILFLPAPRSPKIQAPRCSVYSGSIISDQTGSSARIVFIAVFQDPVSRWALPTLIFNISVYPLLPACTDSSIRMTPMTPDRIFGFPTVILSGKFSYAQPTGNFANYYVTHVVPNVCSFVVPRVKGFCVRTRKACSYRGYGYAGGLNNGGISRSSRCGKSRAGGVY